MKVVILGAGKMGMFLADTLCMDHDVAVYARHPEKLRNIIYYFINTLHIICDSIDWHFGILSLRLIFTLVYTIVLDARRLLCAIIFYIVNVAIESIMVWRIHPEHCTFA